jgi:hypothetical protein
MLEALENTALAAWIRESPSLFAYTLVLSAHAIGLAIVLGANTLIALRLLGFGQTLPLTFLKRLYPVIWVGFVVNAVSGVLLFMAGARNMAALPAFWGKLGFVFVGMIFALLIKSHGLRDETALAAGTVPPVARKLAWGSLFSWYLALIVGRLIGYPELVTSWFGI